mgnify:CR=1 FL=1
MGVRRAVQIMEGAASPQDPVYSVGEIVHNPHVVRALELGGVRQLPGPDDIDGDVGVSTARAVKQGRVAITAHGVGERVLRELESSGLDIVDTTCPIVTRAQRYAQKFVREGWHLLVFGDPGQPEVEAFVSGDLTGVDASSRFEGAQPGQSVGSHAQASACGEGTRKAPS